MIDMHCHLDLYDNPIALLPKVQRLCKYVLAVTTSPRAWQKTKQVFAGFECIEVAVGLHPEIYSSKANEADMLLSNIQNSRCIGEVGIDGSEQHKSSFHAQRDLFRNIVQTAEACGGRIISIHSRNAVKDVLDIIETNIVTSVPILHWFSGTTEEIARANTLGCWFSISPAMLSGKKGRNLVSKMPLSRILPETDAPFTKKRGVPYMPWEAYDVIDTLKEIYLLNTAQIEEQFLSNLSKLATTR